MTLFISRGLTAALFMLALAPRFALGAECANEVKAGTALANNFASKACGRSVHKQGARLNYFPVKGVENGANVFGAYWYQCESARVICQAYIKVDSSCRASFVDLATLRSGSPVCKKFTPPTDSCDPDVERCDSKEID